MSSAFDFIAMTSLLYAWDSFYNQKVTFAHTSQREKRKATTNSVRPNVVWPSPTVAPNRHLVDGF